LFSYNQNFLIRWGTCFT